MSTQKMEDTVDRLLHDAERKKDGAALAQMMADAESAGQLRKEYLRLLAEAEALDPDHECDAWSEADV